MKVFGIFLVVCLASASVASPAGQGQREEKAAEFDEDPFGYFKDMVESFIEGFIGKDNVQVTDDIEVTRNSYRAHGVSARSLALEDKIENYLKSHDVTFKLPVGGALTVGARNLDNDELDLNLKFAGRQVGEARKSKLKKILVPILVFILLKAITVVPLALGVLVLKAFNALQLSVISFVISSGLAIFQLCRKIAENNAHAHLAAHGPWEAPATGRSFDADDAQDLAYAAYIPW